MVWDFLNYYYYYYYYLIFLLFADTRNWTWDPTPAGHVFSWWPSPSSRNTFWSQVTHVYNASTWEVEEEAIVSCIVSFKPACLGCRMKYCLHTHYPPPCPPIHNHPHYPLPTPLTPTPVSTPTTSLPPSPQPIPTPPIHNTEIASKLVNSSLLGCWRELHFLCTWVLEVWEWWSITNRDILCTWSFCRVSTSSQKSEPYHTWRTADLGLYCSSILEFFAFITRYSHLSAAVLFSTLNNSRCTLSSSP